MKEPDVLDGDDGLVGEGLQQRDLLVRELPYLPAAKEEGPDRHAFAEKGHRERSPMPDPGGNRCAEGELGLGVGEVLDVNGPGVHNGPAGNPATVDRIREPGALVHGAVKSGHPELIPFDEQEKGVRRLA